MPRQQDSTTGAQLASSHPPAPGGQHAVLKGSRGARVDRRGLPGRQRGGRQAAGAAGPGLRAACAP